MGPFSFGDERRVYSNPLVRPRSTASWDAVAILATAVPRFARDAGIALRRSRHNPSRPTTARPHRGLFHLATSGRLIRTFWFDNKRTAFVGKRAVFSRVSVEANLQVMPELQFFQLRLQSLAMRGMPDSPQDKAGTKPTVQSRTKKWSSH